MMRTDFASRKSRYFWYSISIIQTSKNLPQSSRNQIIFLLNKSNLQIELYIEIGKEKDNSIKLQDRKLFFHFLCDRKKKKDDSFQSELNRVEKIYFNWKLVLFSDGSKVSGNIYQILSIEIRKWILLINIVWKLEKRSSTVSFPSQSSTKSRLTHHDIWIRENLVWK